MSLHLRNRIYYGVKPLLPMRLRLLMRRLHARSVRRRSADVWPICPSASGKPADWPGWPEGKQFALVLTHDVEGRTGLARCRQLMELEMRQGFRSSFNFVPEGEYEVAGDLREELVRNGFEVGVHDLHHDGKLYQSRRGFLAKVRRINHSLKAWGASGFRAGFMHNNLDWLHELEIRYDASTFDTDPFEPHPDGRNTIFPFWVPRPDRDADGNLNSNLIPGTETKPSAYSRQPSPSVTTCDGYVELPYTLPQDSTLFLVLRERSIGIWRHKLDWVAKHGGMVLLNTHPDYMTFDQSDRSWCHYPVTYYAELLEYVRTNYKGACWQALPREVADYCTTFKPKPAASAAITPGANVSVVRSAPTAKPDQAVCCPIDQI